MHLTSTRTPTGRHRAPRAVGSVRARTVVCALGVGSVMLPAFGVAAAANAGAAQITPVVSSSVAARSTDTIPHDLTAVLGLVNQAVGTQIAGSLAKTPSEDPPPAPDDKGAPADAGDHPDKPADPGDHGDKGAPGVAAVPGDHPDGDHHDGDHPDGDHHGDGDGDHHDGDGDGGHHHWRHHHWRHHHHHDDDAQLPDTGASGSAAGAAALGGLLILGGAALVRGRHRRAD
jgi:LPXTG-motif cell wall-anchored protein